MCLGGYGEGGEVGRGSSRVALEGFGFHYCGWGAAGGGLEVRERETTRFAFKRWFWLPCKEYIIRYSLP